MNVNSPTITAHEDNEKSKSNSSTKTKLDGVAAELGIEKPKVAKPKASSSKESAEGGFVDEDDSGLSPDDKS